MKPRKQLWSDGTRASAGRPSTLVRVYTEGGRVVLQYPTLENPRAKQSWPATKENIAFAIDAGRGAYAALGKPKAITPLTLRDLWTRYAEAEFEHLRPNTRRLYREGWTQFALFLGAQAQVAAITPAQLLEFRRQMTKQGYALSSIRHAIGTVKTVVTWGETLGIVPSLELHRFKFKVAKEARKESPAEYGQAEWRAILAQLDPTKPTQWRPWVVLALCGLQGARQTAVLHLKAGDFDLDRGEVTWRREWDKNGVEWTQPLSAFAADALRVALGWREKLGYTGPWLIPSRGQRSAEVFSIQSVYYALVGAEKRAGIPHRTGRGGHGLRRLLAGDIAALTGDAVTAMRAIGDSVEQADRYLKPRSDRMHEVFGERDADLRRTAPELPRRTSAVPATSVSAWESTTSEAPETGLEPVTRTLPHPSIEGVGQSPVRLIVGQPTYLPPGDVVFGAPTAPEMPFPENGGGK